MKRILKQLSLVFGGVLAMGAHAQKPKLVVSIVVDQMRADYLTRWADLYEGGFATLLANGEVFYNAHYTYAPTYTGPGHASIYTGTDPRYHGIIANDWYQPESRDFMYCVEDADVTGVGVGLDPQAYQGKRGPKNIKSSTWTDELELASDGASKVYGFSLKDRGAITAAGHFGDGAFWLDASGFITSTAYMEELPVWMQRFNKKYSPESYMKGSWDYVRDRSLYPSTYTNAYERAPKGAASANFPYDLAALYKAGGVEALKATPWGNQILIDVALTAVKAEKLGQNPSGATDVLGISFS
ncbi:MAG: alkaline phosphatase family protein, partial [Flavobacteriia bacterium]|nr:alkaline phosphatase family protein [Flavobacteriia bacterium]